MDSNGVTVWQWDGEAFGNTPPNANPGGQGDFVFNLRFPGQYFDAETNLHYNYFRDYDPVTGRYVESDPTGLNGGISTYAHVGGNPISYIDPDGLNPVAGAIAGVEIGTAILPGPGTVVGAVVGTGVGLGLGYLLNNAIQQSKLPPGAIDAIPGSKEWGRRNGIGGRESVDIFHGIKSGNKGKPGSKAADDCSVNPNTGDVYDGQGEHIGNLGESH